jgi:hypothetical protein
MVALAGWLVLFGFPGVGFAMFGIGLVAGFVWLPGLLVLAMLYLRGPPGRIRHPKRIFMVAAGAAALYIPFWLFVLPTNMLPDGIDGFLANGLVDIAVLLALAERAEALGRPRVVEFLFGAVGAYVCLVTFVHEGGGSVLLRLSIGLGMLVGLQAFALRRWTRVAIAVGAIPVAWGLDGLLDHGILLVLAEVALVLGYAAALWFALPHLRPPATRRPT